MVGRMMVLPHPGHHTTNTNVHNNIWLLFAPPPPPTLVDLKSAVGRVFNALLHLKTIVVIHGRRDHTG